MQEIDRKIIRARRDTIGDAIGDAIRRSTGFLTRSGSRP
jgi:hypothetical protein